MYLTGCSTLVKEVVSEKDPFSYFHHMDYVDVVDQIDRDLWSFILSLVSHDGSVHWWMFREL